MPSHMSSIGFPVDNIQDFTALGNQAIKYGKMVNAFDGASYRLWSPGEGVELWAQVDPKGRPIGLVPHFRGQAEMTLRLERCVKRPKHNPLDGAFEGFAECPIVFDSPDFGAHNSLTLPKDAVVVQIAAFARNLRSFESEAQMRATEGWLREMGTESMIPSGTMTPQGKRVDPPNSETICCGIVSETTEIVNPFTTQKFIWARVRTLGGELDLVADPTIVQGTVKSNSILGGTFYLTGLLK